MSVIALLTNFQNNQKATVKRVDFIFILFF